jgi:hypothetical protein
MVPPRANLAQGRQAAIRHLPDSPRKAVVVVQVVTAALRELVALEVAAPLLQRPAERALQAKGTLVATARMTRNI